MARGTKAQRKDGPRSRGKGQRFDHGINPAYQDMLDEANSSPTQTSDEGRTIKRRRIRGRIVAQNDDIDPRTTKSSSDRMASSTRSHIDHGLQHDAVMPELAHPLQQKQTAYKDDSSDESDFAWEEVGLPEEPQVSDDQQGEQEEQQLDLVLNGDIIEDSTSPATARRKPLTALERKLRLEVHKRVLYRRLPKQIVSLLNPEEKYSQFRQDESLKEGLKKACDYFRDAFTITARGLSRSHWAEDLENTPIQPPSDLDILMQKSDLLDCANKLQGSRDVGTQLFCALLRSAGVETRLVCSLQVLPLIATAKGAAPQKPPVKQMSIVNYNPPTSDNDSDHHVPTSQRSSSPLSKRPIGATGGLTRFSNPHAPATVSNPAPRSSPKPKPKRFRESPNPIYWLEVFNPYSNNYTALDPLVTHTIGKPSALTPPLSDPLNSLSYAIAFNDDLTAKDVTRRYTRAYNAKILKQRIDLSQQGKAWLSSVLGLFSYRGRNPSAKDQQEDAELAKKEASEPMPRNIQDFKNHPVYALERHLHRNEVIHPRHEMGRVNTGTGSKNEGKSEPVFRRKDVLTCRTADQWFRVGKEVKAGEQPLKRLLPAASSSKRSRRSPTPNEDEHDGEAGIKNLYALHQTKLYVPQPIPPSGAPIPRNAFRNLDVYVPSMVPARGWHSPHPLTSTAAKALVIDHVPAVTGFSFSSGGGKGRSRGTATVTGAVVWEGHREAVEAAIEGLEALAENDERERWRTVLWSTWRKMIRGLKVRQRVKGYQIEGEDTEKVEEAATEVEDDEMENEEEEDGGGGFFPEYGGDEAMPTAQPTRRGGRKMLLDSESEDEEYFGKDERQGVQAHKSPLRYLPQSTLLAGKTPEESLTEAAEAGGFFPNNADEAGGGFIPEEAEDSGGGFLTEGPIAQIQQNIRDYGNTLQQRTPPPPPQSPDPDGYDAHPIELSSTRPKGPNQTTARDGASKSSRRNSPEMLAPPFGHLTEEELAEAKMLEEFYAEGKRDDGMQEAADAESEEEAEKEEENAVHMSIPTSKVEDDIEENRAEVEADQEGDDEEDKGSLLSEDPSDAEAEPDWLT
ncbi:MAG: hypothetical protein Q9221_006318 [Calogaya cf. arnoldii]